MIQHHIIRNFTCISYLLVITHHIILIHLERERIKDEETEMMIMIFAGVLKRWKIVTPSEGYTCQM